MLPSSVMDLHAYNEPSGLFRFTYPAGWAVQQGESFQVVNSRPPHGAITISFFIVAAEGSLGAPAELRLSYAERQTMGGEAGPDVESWTFAAGRVAGMITYVHSLADAEAEAADAAAIIDSIVIRTDVVPRARSWWRRLLRI